MSDALSNQKKIPTEDKVKYSTCTDFNKIWGAGAIDTEVGIVKNGIWRISQGFDLLHERSRTESSEIDSYALWMSVSHGSAQEVSILCRCKCVRIFYNFIITVIRTIPFDAAQKNKINTSIQPIKCNGKWKFIKTMNISLFADGGVNFAA